MKIIQILSVVIIIIFFNLSCAFIRELSYEEVSNESMKFDCQPRPRSIPLYQLPVEKNTNEHFFPPYIVLHRCDSGSGCCFQVSGNLQFKCLPTKEERLIITFRFVSSYETDTPFQLGKTTVVNHTACECQHAYQ